MSEDPTCWRCAICARRRREQKWRRLGTSRRGAGSNGAATVAIENRACIAEYDRGRRYDDLPGSTQTGSFGDLRRASQERGTCPRVAARLWGAVFGGKESLGPGGDGRSVLAVTRSGGARTGDGGGFTSTSPGRRNRRRELGSTEMPHSRLQLRSGELRRGTVRGVRSKFAGPAGGVLLARPGASDVLFMRAIERHDPDARKRVTERSTD